MMEFSKSTITEYMPVMRTMYAAIEVELVDYPKLDERITLHVQYLEKEFGSAKIHFSFEIFNHWLKGSDFSAGLFAFRNHRQEASWSDMLKILQRHGHPRTNGCSASINRS